MLATGAGVCAGEPNPLATAKPAETLTNDSIIELQSLNLGDAVIIEKIKASKCDFDVSVNGLKLLKQAKVSDPVIQAMIASKAPSAPKGALATPAVAGDPNDPNAPHELGVWLYEENSGQKKMTRLEPEISRMWMPTGMGFGSAIRAVLTGLHAAVQVSSRRPVCYMYFGEGGQGIAGAGSPNELPLARLTLKEKTNERLLIVGSVAPFGGVNTGIKKDALRAVSAEKMAAGVYKITPQEDLPEGEYGFCYLVSGAMGAGKMFCFAVR